MKTRKTARLLVLDPADRLLLIQFVLPNRAEPFWATVGGVIEQGETFQQAAIRELLEETGITESNVEISDCLWFGDHELELNGEKTHLHELFAIARVKQFTLCTDRMTEDEKIVCRGHKWWTLEELQHTKQTVYPQCLPNLVRAALSGILPSNAAEIKL